MSDGLLGRKVGMTQIFSEDGQAIPVTVIEAGPCPVVQVKTEATDGYKAVQLGFQDRRASALNRPERGHFEKAGVDTKRYLREFRTDDVDSVEVAQSLTVEMFSEGELVDVTGTSKGRGFTGVVKRWKFSGGRKSHGGEQDLRRPGSIGQSSYPSRVIKGKRMAGRHGGTTTTVQNLKVVKADPARNLLAVKGAVPGPNNGMVVIRRAVKSARS